MTKSEIIARLNSKTGSLSAKYVSKAVDVILERITEALEQGRRVELRGFGVFSTRRRNARAARNPKNGAPVSVPSKSVPFFKSGKALKEKLNKK